MRNRNFVLSILGLFLASVGVLGTLVSDPAPEVTSVSVESAEEDSAIVDYRSGAWYVDDVKVPLDCPQEDSCDADYGHGAWVFFKTP